MSVTPEGIRLTYAASRYPLFSAEPFGTCKWHSTYYPRCQHGAQLALFGHAKVSAHTRAGPCRARRRGLSFTYSSKAGDFAGLSGPTTQRALRDLQQTCFAAAKQADKEELLSSYTADSIPATDQEHTQLPQVLICNAQTLTAEVYIWLGHSISYMH